MHSIDGGDCIDGPSGCSGESTARPALSGSGDTYPRCQRHYDAYAERVQPRIDRINRRHGTPPGMWRNR